MAELGSVSLTSDGVQTKGQLVKLGPGSNLYLDSRVSVLAPLPPCLPSTTVFAPGLLHGHTSDLRATFNFPTKLLIMIPLHCRHQAWLQEYFQRAHDDEGKPCRLQVSWQVGHVVMMVVN